MTREHDVFLENLRKSGAVNMFDAAPYLETAFGLSKKEASNILLNWMKNYNPDDYDED